MKLDRILDSDVQRITTARWRQVTRSERRCEKRGSVRARGRVPHRKRSTIEGGQGVHVTWKLVEGIPSLRQKRVLAELTGCFRVAKERFGLARIGYTVMGNHLHRIVGAKSDESLRSGLQGLGIRLARAVHRISGRRGRAFRERFFARALRTRSAVYYAVRYALQNARKHGDRIPEGEWDPYSSARFSTMREDTPASERPVVLVDGFLWAWLACGLNSLQPSDVPGSRIRA